VIDLNEDFCRALERETPAQHRRLRALKLPYFVSTVRATPDSDTTWQPDDAGRVYMLFPVWDRPLAEPHAPAGPWVDIADEMAQIIDLAVWRPDEPDTVLLRGGRVAALGETALGWRCGPPLRIHRDPLAYWRAAGHGAVILDWQACRSSLLDHDQIICDDLATAEKVDHHIHAARRALTPRLPRLLIPEASVAANTPPGP
jgi:hypothetical protein